MIWVVLGESQSGPGIGEMPILGVWVVLGAGLVYIGQLGLGKCIGSRTIPALMGMVLIDHIAAGSTHFELDCLFVYTTKQLALYTVHMNIYAKEKV